MIIMMIIIIILLKCGDNKRKYIKRGKVTQKTSNQQ